MRHLQFQLHKSKLFWCIFPWGVQNTKWC